MGIVSSLRGLVAYDTAFPQSKSRRIAAPKRAACREVIPMKMRHLVGLLGVVAMLAPGFAMAEDPPIPLPRRPDRLPTATEQSAPQPAAETAPEAAAAPTPTASAVAAAAVAAVEKIAKPPQPVTLMAKITDGGSTIADGLVWRVFETRTDSSGELALAAKSEDATAHLQLTPGSYVVHVAYGRAQTTDTINVSEGSNEKALVLDAGAMRLNAAVTGDIAIPINLLRFDIYAAGPESERTLVAQNLTSNDIVTLNGGTYHIVSYFGDVNAVVRADLRVEPGQLTDATLYHKASQVSFKLVSEPGGEAIADIDWTVKTQDGQTVFTNTGAFPSTVLQEGDYLILAKRGEQVYSREFQVKAGAGEEIEVLTTVY
jgi:hypothetical protein